MNRIVLIGNGFDLAHGLPTRYEDFINWYWDQRVLGFRDTYSEISKDLLCTFKREESFTWSSFYNQIISPIQKLNGKDIIDNVIHNKYGVWMGYSFSPFFDSIIKSIETKGWVDIENEYYRQLTKCTIQGPLNQKELEELNSQLSYLTDRLVEYLKTLRKKTVKIKAISNIIYSPIKIDDVSIEGRHLVKEYVKDMFRKDDKEYDIIAGYNLKKNSGLREYSRVKDYFEKSGEIYYYPKLCMLPYGVLFLNFNYTDTDKSYVQPSVCRNTIHIHGELNKPDSIIFGYGDELDEKYKQLKALNENECLKNIKSIKYLESDNYRGVLSFLESAPFQVLIMGHSCGNSDRTLLNTLFEHKNCISIKPYYYQKADGADNYLDIIQNISRNFTDMKLMRDRVVNKTYCEPLT